MICCVYSLKSPRWGDFNIEAILMRTHSIPSCQRKSKKIPVLGRLTWRYDLDSLSRTAPVQTFFIVPKLFEPSKFDCIQRLSLFPIHTYSICYYDNMLICCKSKIIPWDFLFSYATKNTYQKQLNLSTGCLPVAVNFTCHHTKNLENVKKSVFKSADICKQCSWWPKHALLDPKGSGQIWEGWSGHEWSLKTASDKFSHDNAYIIGRQEVIYRFSHHVSGTRNEKKV